MITLIRRSEIISFIIQLTGELSSARPINTAVIYWSVGLIVGRNCFQQKPAVSRAAGSLSFLTKIHTADFNANDSRIVRGSDLASCRVLISLSYTERKSIYERCLSSEY